MLPPVHSTTNGYPLWVLPPIIATTWVMSSMVLPSMCPIISGLLLSIGAETFQYWYPSMQLLFVHPYYRTARIRHQCRKAAVLSCHRYLINIGVEKNELPLNTDYNFDHQMSLSKSKCWYSNNCLHLLQCAVPFIINNYKKLSVFDDVPFPGTE